MGYFMNDLLLSYIIVAVILIIGGLLLTFAGNRYFKIALVLLGFLFGVLSSWFILEGLIADKNIAIIIAIAFGILLGVLILSFYYTGIFLAGSLIGIIIFYYLPLRETGFERYIVLAILILSCGIIAIMMHKIVIVVATSIIGSALLVHGAGFLIFQFYIGNYDFSGYSSYIESKNNLFYFSLLFILIFAISGLIVQLRLNKRR